MNRRLLAAVAIASAVLVVALREDPSAQGGSAWVAPRTPWGDPDLQGVWPGTAMMDVPIERPRPAWRASGAQRRRIPGHEGNYGMRNILSGSRADERLGR